MGKPWSYAICFAIFVVGIAGLLTGCAGSGMVTPPLPVTTNTAFSSDGSNGYLIFQGTQYLVADTSEVLSFMKQVFSMPSGRVNIDVSSSTDRAGNVPYTMALPHFQKGNRGSNGHADSVEINYNGSNVVVTTVLNATQGRMYRVTNGTNSEDVATDNQSLAGALSRQLTSADRFQSASISFGAVYVCSYVLGV